MTIEIPGYKILGTLGKGGMATVYLAEHEIFQRKVALKVMAQGLTDDSSFGDRFMREARIVSQLVHPNIVTVYDVGVHEGNYYLSMEFIDGQDLKHARKDLTLAQKVRIILDIAKALEYAGNKGYVHRDIKPENIMLYTDDNRAVLTDFGIARAAEMEISVTQTGAAIGTPHYMSPEQAKGQPVDIRSDLYGLGVVFYLLLVGCVPYDAESAVAIGIKHITDPIPDLPEGLESLQPIIDRMMAKLPQDRYQKPAALVADLSKLDLEALTAEAETAYARAEKSLEEASADAPTIITNAASRGGVHFPDPLHRREPRRQPAEDLDPTPVVAPAAVDLEEDSSVWPWVSGILVLVAVLAGVLYSQYSSEVDAWLGEQGSAFEAAVPEAEPPTPADPTQPPVPGGAPGEADAEPAPTSEAPAPAAGGAKGQAEALRQRITELQNQVQEDPAALARLVEAWRQFAQAQPGATGVQTAIPDLLAEQAARVRELARAGRLAEARARLDHLDTLLKSPQAVVALRDYVERQAQVQQLLTEAEALLSAGDLIQPEGANARERFQKVLDLDPHNPRARDGLTAIAGRLAERAASALQNDQIEQAQDYLARAAEIDPDQARLNELRGQLAERAERAEADAGFQALIERAEARLREGDYFTPTGESAYHFFSQARALRPESPAVRNGISRTIEGFEERLFNLLAVDHIDPVRDMLRTAMQALPNDERLAALEIRVEEAIAEKRLAQQPRVVNILVTASPAARVVGPQPAAIEVDRTIFVSFRYDNLNADTSVINATLMDGARSMQIAQVPVVVTGSTGTKTFRIDRPVDGFSPGRYTIDLILNGKALASRDFQVE